MSRGKKLVELAREQSLLELPVDVIGANIVPSSSTYNTFALP